jgi:hypothetical protein
MRYFLMVLVMTAMMVPSAMAQPVPQAAPVITYKQALHQEGAQSHGRWVTLSRQISKDYRIKYSTLKQQANKEWHATNDPAARKAIDERFAKQAKQLYDATQANLKKTYSDLELYYNYNIEQIKKQYGVTS